MVMLAIVRFPRDQIPTPTLAKVIRVRRGRALVAKAMRFGPLRRWAKPRWVPAADVARQATPREVEQGHPIDPIPRSWR